MWNDRDKMVWVAQFPLEFTGLVEELTWRPCHRGRYADSSRGKMHVLMYPECPDGLVRDHISGNGFDNRRENIRFVPQKHNGFNRRTRKYPPGVRVSAGQQFRAELSLGYFKTVDEAHEAWKTAYVAVYGELPECVAS